MEKRRMRISGVYISQARLNWLKEKIEEYASRRNYNVSENGIRYEVQRNLSIIARRPVSLSDRSWARWKEVFYPEYIARHYRDLAYLADLEDKQNLTFRM